MALMISLTLFGPHCNTEQAASLIELLPNCVEPLLRDCILRVFA
ncbi:MAG TPA: hypothetical protein PLS42_02190 [Candidatus Competibacter denitrificans]|nr:hypothetical protein [Candidatus Competibacter denitrificans]